jgi:hypothetical protein
MSRYESSCDNLPSCRWSVLSCILNCQTTWATRSTYIHNFDIYILSEKITYSVLCAFIQLSVWVIEWFRGVTIHFFHKRYVSRYLICITIRNMIRFIGNCNYSLKYMLVDMDTPMFFFIWGRLHTSGNYKYLIFD